MALRTSLKAAQFGESVIRDMTRLFLNQQAALGSAPGANLAQGFPDFPAPPEMKEAACRAIHADINQYAITWGSPSLRNAISAKTELFYGHRPNPATDITVACGSTESMMAALLAVVNPGDEVIVFEPFYENYGPDAILSGAVPRYVTLHEPTEGEPAWHFDPDALAAAFNDRTRAIIINTPHNPTGKVYTREELELIAALCRKWNVAAITDEIYEHIVYVGEHIRIADLDGMRELSITISGLSKTYSATGWRIGWLIAPPKVTDAIRKVHDFLTVGAAAPLQEGAAFALGFPMEYYKNLEIQYLQKRNFLANSLESSGFKVYLPDGAYYIMTDISALTKEDDTLFAHELIARLGLATVPGSSFYHEKNLGRTKLRFCFCKRQETLELASALLSKLSLYI